MEGKICVAEIEVYATQKKQGIKGKRSPNESRKQQTKYYFTQATQAHDCELDFSMYVLQFSAFLRMIFWEWKAATPI